MFKRSAITAIVTLLFTASLLACSNRIIRDIPQDTQGGVKYKGVQSGDYDRLLYTHDPIGQVESLGFEEPEVQPIMAEGVATIFGGNVDSARKAALRNAYAEAVNIGSGVEIGSLTLIRNVKYVTDIISSRSRGFIRSYEIIREGISKTNNSRYEILIEAIVVSEGKAMGDEREALRLYLELLGNPRLLIILPEKRISVGESMGVDSQDIRKKETDKTQVEYKKGDTTIRIIDESQKKSSKQGGNQYYPEEDAGTMMRSTEAALAQAFSQYGYQVITSDDLLAQGLCTPEVLAQAKAGVTARALEVARAAEADLALLGVIRLTQENVKPAGVDLVMVSAEASAKALIVSSGKQIEVFHRMERASHPQMLMAYGQCLDRIAVNLSDVLAWKIPQILTNEFREMKVEFSGINREQLMDIRDYLSKLDGIEQVRISQIPTETKPLAKIVLLSGYISLEPYEIVEACSNAINKKLNLLVANKFEMKFKIDTSY